MVALTLRRGRDLRREIVDAPHHGVGVSRGRRSDGLRRPRRSRCQRRDDPRRQLGHGMPWLDRHVRAPVDDARRGHHVAVASRVDAGSELACGVPQLDACRSTVVHVETTAGRANHRRRTVPVLAGQPAPRLDTIGRGVMPVEIDHVQPGRSAVDADIRVRHVRPPFEDTLHVTRRVVLPGGPSRRLLTPRREGEHVPT